jgi:hypothetical protein
MLADGMIAGSQQQRQRQQQQQQGAAADGFGEPAAFGPDGQVNGMPPQGAFACGRGARVKERLAASPPAPAARVLTVLAVAPPGCHAVVCGQATGMATARRQAMAAPTDPMLAPQARWIPMQQRATAATLGTPMQAPQVRVGARMPLARRAVLGTAL